MSFSHDVQGMPLYNKFQYPSDVRLEGSLGTREERKDEKPFHKRRNVVFEEMCNEINQSEKENRLQVSRDQLWDFFLISKLSVMGPSRMLDFLLGNNPGQVVIDSFLSFLPSRRRLLFVKVLAIGFDNRANWQEQQEELNSTFFLVSNAFLMVSSLEISNLFELNLSKKKSKKQRNEVEEEEFNQTKPLKRIFFIKDFFFDNRRSVWNFNFIRFVFCVSIFHAFQSPSSSLSLSCSPGLSAALTHSLK